MRVHCHRCYHNVHNVIKDKSMTVNFVSVGAKELPICFSMRALNQFCVKHKLTVGQSFAMLGGGDGEDLSSSMQLTYDQIADLFFFALKEGHRKENKKYDLTIEQVFDLFDEKPGLLAEVLEMYGNSLAQKWAAAEEKNSKALKAKKAESAK